MFISNRQQRLSCFDFPLGEMDPDNRWVVLEEHVPWDLVDDIYSAKFKNKRRGKAAYSSRVAFGALLIQQILNCSDRELVAQVKENPYLQYFLGLDGYKTNCPFAASTLVDFRKRFSDADLAAINERIAKNKEVDDDLGDDDDDDDDGGTLIMDATVVPANIKYPQDSALLFETREKLENIIDDLSAQTKVKKPRTYRQVAKKAAQSFSKKRRKSAKQIRKCIKSQLSYIRRDFKSIGALLENEGAKLDEKKSDTLTCAWLVFEQQQMMYQRKTHTCKDRIVSFSQPWIRPIVRGKAKSPTEFGPKIHAVIEDGLMLIDEISFDPFNESERLVSCAKTYKDRHGSYPKAILADRIYQSRANRMWCKERGIRLTGPKLGRPVKDEAIRKDERQQMLKDTSKRNLIEATFGTLKGSFGLGRLSVKLKETSKTVIAMAAIAFNLKKLVRLFHVLFRWLDFEPKYWKFHYLLATNFFDC